MILLHTYLVNKTALLHFRTPPFVIDDSLWKNAAESFTVALTLTLGGYESAIAPRILMEPHLEFDSKLTF